MKYYEVLKWRETGFTKTILDTKYKTKLANNVHVPSGEVLKSWGG